MKLDTRKLHELRDEIAQFPTKLKECKDYEIEQLLFICKKHRERLLENHTWILMGNEKMKDLNPSDYNEHYAKRDWKNLNSQGGYTYNELLALEHILKKELQSRIPKSSLQDSNELSLTQIALKYYYEGNPITDKNGDEIARAYGHKSGHKLYQNYNRIQQKVNRIGDPGSSRKIKHMLKDLETVILLIEKGQNEAQNDINELRTISKKHYENI